MSNNPKNIIEYFQKSSIEQINLDVKNGRSTTKSQAGTEAESSKDYVGRVVFEFFQNAVDRAEKNVWLELIQDNNGYKFIISNDGKPFSIYKDLVHDKKSDFHSLNSIHDGAKIAGESIGNKGVGFKSCWNVSSKVRIESLKEDDSWGFELYNPVTIDNFKDLTIQDAIKNVGGKVPSFYFPKYIENKKTGFNGNAVTKITIFLNNEVSYNEIQNELEEFKKTKFFFLQYLKNKQDKDYKLYIKIGDDEKILESSDNDWKFIDLKTHDKFKNEYKELKEAKVREKYKNIPDEPNIAIAFPPDNIKDIDTKFYTYLPTEEDCGFNVLIHADFALDNARVKILPNQYNKKIREIAAKMLVNELLINPGLHEYKNFPKFMNPIKSEQEFYNIVWQELIEKNILTSMLKKVFCDKTKKINDLRYMEIFHTIEQWEKLQKDKDEHKKLKYRERIYKDLLQYFCDDEICIVPIDGSYVTSIPKYSKEDINEKDNSRKLFYMASREDNVDFSLLENVTSIDISSFEEINKEYFTDQINLVKKFNTLEVVRALSTEPKDNIEINKNILAFIYQWLSRDNGYVNDKLNIKYFEKNSKTRNNDQGNYLSKILFPTINNGWQPAKKCFFNIPTMISQKFENFYEVDYKNIQYIFNDIQDLKYFGVWDTLPITEDFNLPWREDDLPQVDDSKFKLLLQDSISIWKEIEGISKDDIKKVFFKIKDQNIFFDEIHKEYCKPSDVFLFNEHDKIKRKGVNQESKKETLSYLYEMLNIESIEDTRNTNKLYKQLNKLEKEEITKTHKTLYKQIILALSKSTEYKRFDSIPLLTENGYSEKGNVWFADRNSKKYMHHFDLNFILFDIETNKGFVQHFGIKPFEPIYNLKPDNAKEISDDALKQKIENNFLVELFCLAEEVISINGFNKEDAIARWNNLKIGHAKNVWLEITLNHTKQIETVGYTTVDNDVLFKPLSSSQRQTNKHGVGEFIHDLRGNNAQEIIENIRFSKFGYVIADGVFRDTALGSIFSDYLKNDSPEDKNNFLKERGISDSDIQEMRNFINKSILTENEIEIIIKTLNTISNRINIDDSNWHFLDTYSDLDISYKILEKLFSDESEKIKDVIMYLNPKLHNILKIKNDKENIQLKYYIKNGIKLSDSDFDEKVENMKESLFYFNLEVAMINEYFQIDEITEDEALIAKIELDCDIKIKTSEVKVIDSVIVENNQQFNENKTTNVSRISEKNRIESSEKQQKRGLAYEKIFAIKQASKIMYNSKLLDDFTSQYNENWGKQYGKINTQKINLQSLADILQVSKTIGDGLGYDVLELVINEPKEFVLINKVEIKSSKGNNTIHFSNNEIEQIHKMIDDKSWKLYHFVDDEVFDRTISIKNEIQKLIKQKENHKSNFLAESWIISFK